MTEMGWGHFLLFLYSLQWPSPSSMPPRKMTPSHPQTFRGYALGSLWAELVRDPETWDCADFQNHKSNMCSSWKI